MKKYLFLAVFILIFNLNFNTVSAWDSGCNGVDPFSSTTGQSCGEKKADCNVGELFSVMTGQPCPKVVGEEVLTDPKVLACQEAKDSLVSSKEQLVQLDYDLKQEMKDLKEKNTTYYSRFRLSVDTIKKYKSLMNPINQKIDDLKDEILLTCN